MSFHVTTTTSNSSASSISVSPFISLFRTFLFGYMLSLTILGFLFSSKVWSLFLLLNMASIGFVHVFSIAPSTKSKWFNWKNSLSWSTYVELWFLGQGYCDHLEIELNYTPNAYISQWQKVSNYVLFCGNQFSLMFSRCSYPSENVSHVGRMQKKISLMISNISLM